MTFFQIELAKANEKIALLQKEVGLCQHKLMLTSIDVERKEKKLKECKNDNIKLHLKLAKQK